MHTGQPVLSATAVGVPVHERRPNMLASVAVAGVAGAIMGSGACATVERMDELPWYGCIALGLGHAVPVGLAASWTVDTEGECCEQRPTWGRESVPFWGASLRSDTTMGIEASCCFRPPLQRSDFWLPWLPGRALDAVP